MLVSRKTTLRLDSTALRRHEHRKAGTGMAEALFLELELPALLGKSARRTEAGKKAVGGTISLDGVPRAGKLAASHADEATATAKLGGAVHDCFVANHTLHGVLTYRRIFEGLVPSAVTAVRDAGQEPRNNAGQGVCEAVKNAV